MTEEQLVKYFPYALIIIGALIADLSSTLRFTGLVVVAVGTCISIARYYKTQRKERRY